MKIKVLLCVKDIKEFENAPVLDKHYEYYPIYNGLVKNFSDLSKILRKIQPMVILTTKNCDSVHILNTLPFEYRKRWIEYNEVTDIKPYSVINCYIDSALNKKRNEILFSVISSTYHSGDKIFRPLSSLNSQTYRNWEWIIWDDSQPTHKECWENLLNFQKNDIRIRCYRDCDNSGFIGEMKHRASSMAKGDWIVELDHDDNIHPLLFEWCLKVIQENPNVDFISSDCVKFDETKKIGTTYGDDFAVGYGTNIKVWFNNTWTTVIKNNDITPETIRHIVGVPNHVRIWKRSFYEKIGRHNSLLPVVDDYELLLRSFFEGNWVNISYPAYVQYDNVGGNNFTYLRNSLIQHLVFEVRKFYENEIHKRIVSLGNEDYSMGKFKYRGKAWLLHYKDFNYKKFITNFDPLIDRKNTIGVILTVNNGGLEEIYSYINQTDKNTVLYVIGNKSIDLDTTMNLFAKILSQQDLLRIRWWNLINSVDNLVVARNYALRMLNTCPIVTFINEGEKLKVDHIEKLRNSLCEKDFFIDENNYIINRISIFEKYGDFDSTHEEFISRIQEIF